MLKGFGSMIAMLAALLIMAAFSIGLSNAIAAVDTSQVSVLDYSSTNVTTSAYVTLVASSPKAVGQLQVCDTSTRLLKIAMGSSGNEVDLFTVQISGCVVIPYFLPKGTRLSIRAISATANSGYNTVSFLQ